MVKTLFVIGETSSVPGLPLIYGKKFDPFSVFYAVESAILNLGEKSR